MISEHASLIGRLMKDLLKLYGLEDDLHISDDQYLLCLTLFFIPYSLLEVSPFCLT